MIDTTVVVRCDHLDDPQGDYCEAEFEVLRTEPPDGLNEVVDRQLRLRGWEGSVLDRVTCPLHRPPGTAVEVRPASPSAITPPTDPRPALYDALTRIVGDIGPINDESSRRTAAHMLRHYGAEVREARP